MSKSKKVTIDEAQNTITSAKSNKFVGLIKQSSFNISHDQDEKNGRFSVSPVPPKTDEGRAIKKNLILHELSL